MNLDLVPIWVVFIGTILLVMVFIEVGYRLGGIAHRKSVERKRRRFPACPLPSWA